MKIQVWSDHLNDRIADFDIVEEPTKEICELIQDEIDEEIEELEEEQEWEFDADEYWNICYQVVNRHLTIIDNPVIRTIYAR